MFPLLANCFIDFPIFFVSGLLQKTQSTVMQRSLIWWTQFSPQTVCSNVTQNSVLKCATKLWRSSDLHLLKFDKMNYLREFLYRPKRSDRSLMARFYFADEALSGKRLDNFK